MTITIVRFWINDRTAPAETLLTAVESLDSVPRFVNIVLTYQALNALIYALAGAFLLVLLRVIVRKTWIAVLVLSLPTNALVLGGGAPFGWESPFVMAIPLIALAVFLRVGLLAYCAMVFTDILVRVPITLDVDAWFFGHSLATLVLLAALAVSAFLVSLAVGLRLEACQEQHWLHNPAEENRVRPRSPAAQRRRRSGDLPPLAFVHNGQIHSPVTCCVSLAPPRNGGAS